ncbi:MAG: hypothetical protein R6W66_09260 [Pelovirga sp.]|jgi:hypothetical protein
MEFKSNRLGEMLLDAGLIDHFQLESALSMQRNLGGQIGAALVKLGYLPEETILEFLESQQLYTRVKLSDLDIGEELMSLLPLERMMKCKVIPVELRRQGNEKLLRLAMTDPTDVRLIDDLQFSTGCKILPLLATEEDVLQAIESNRSQAQLDQTLQETVEELELVFSGSFDDLEPGCDPCLERLLHILRDKGVLSAAEVDRVKNTP